MRVNVRLTACVSAVLLITGCTSNASGGSDRSGGSAAYAENGTFTLILPDDPRVFDPYHSQSLYRYAKLAYDSLVNLQPDGKFVSGLAEKWTADADSAAFTLRPDITCSDGTALTAGQVAADLNYLADPKNQSPLLGTYVPTVPFTATGNDAQRTVTVSLKKPFGFLLNTIGLVPIMCAKGLQDKEMLKSGSDGTGPFVLSKVEPGQSYTFTVRKGYRWGPNGATTDVPGTPGTVVLSVISNPSTATNLVLSGQANLAKVDGEDQVRLDSQGLDKVEVPATGAWLWFNQIGDRPTADRRVRQALVQALDLDAVVKVNTAGKGTRSTGLVALDPNPCPGDTVSGQLPGRDVANANSLLDQAGWVQGADGVRSKNGKPLSLELHYNPTVFPLNKPTAELMTEQWKAVGVQVKPISDTAPAINKVLFQTSNYDLTLTSLSINLPSQAVPFLSGPNPPEGTNLAGVDNKSYNALVAKAAAKAAPDSCASWSQAEQSLYRAFDVVPLAKQPNLYYLNHAEAAIAGFEIVPTSLKVLS